MCSCSSTIATQTICPCVSFIDPNRPAILLLRPPLQLPILLSVPAYLPASFLRLKGQVAVIAEVKLDVEPIPSTLATYVILYNDFECVGEALVRKRMREAAD